MASANSLLQFSPSESTEDVYALIERSFFGDGGAPSVNLFKPRFATILRCCWKRLKDRADPTVRDKRWESRTGDICCLGIGRVLAQRFTRSG